ncbi:hypothetical protein L905_06985 [Agrobacterium sp. TS43]|uniref:hypothetical protein n=1 Tax=Agrobacterium TaxID=357 RepID=UPI00036693A7|nr:MULTISPECIES: hypothetical protein [Agrobacterium]EPR21239.1 hypothetical protein L902_01825 [Agrobacterium radiobacter DSM 30147]KDR88748.1 hypothetical protein K538_00790 [Agrobacterium tumefaciens GW4]KVK49892.1 hypothetical protein L903_18640 [Agrobacterium sp. JL28]KVK50183.1 hypothetical protein L904_18635 [Agrobacterium sp. LY4]KVK59226.1 hypothetical protein L905_06985 [Agrobacterium sp. TS43]
MTSNNPVELCESILRAEISYNTERHILPSENIVAHRFLSRQPELVEAYTELVGKLHKHRNALESCLKAILYTSAFWSPGKLDKARRDRERLDAVNAAIASKAGELALLLEERSELHNKSQFHSDTHYDVCDVIVQAAAQNHRFNSFVRPEFSALSGQYDLKYWPTLGEFAHTLSNDAAAARSLASDPLTAVGTKASRASLADYFKALFAAMEENGVKDHGFLPHGFRISDSTFASIAACALDLGADDIVDAAYVKRLRQRQREESVRNNAGDRLG